MAQLYFVAVVLPQVLNEEIRAFKTHMQQGWGCKVALKSPAHITLLPPYWMEGDLEASLLSDLTALSRPVPPFLIRLNHFSAFKPRTIFVAVHPSELLFKLKAAVDGHFTMHKQYKAKPDRRLFHPHITIATRDLHKKSFAEAWPIYESKPYERTFTASGLSVLRHNGRDWDIIATTPFEGAAQGQ